MRKVKTTPFQREVLWSLAETGERGVLVMLDILRSRFPDDTPDALLKELERSLGILGRMGCLYLCWQDENERRPVLVDERRTLSFKHLLRWNEASKHWVMLEQASPVKDIIVQLTKGGVEVLELIAQQHNGAPVWRQR